MADNAPNPNAEPIEFWNGSAADAWVTDQERLDRMLAPLSAEAVRAARVTEGERVLDIGCGCGASSIQIADLGASVVGVDISAPILNRARERVRDRDDVTFLDADAADTWRPPGRASCSIRTLSIGERSKALAKCTSR